MKAFHQGQLDFFCAAYSVLNALQITHSLSIGEAAKILARTIKQLSASKKYWNATLDNSTDFHWLPLWMLASVAKGLPLKVCQPFPVGSEPKHWSFPGSVRIDFENQPLNLPKDRNVIIRKPETIATSIQNWLEDGMLRSVVFRFHRHLPFRGHPIISHWSTGRYIANGHLHLLDSSKEEGALHSIQLDNFCTDTSALREDCLIRIEPDSIYLIEAAE